MPKKRLHVIWGVISAALVATILILGFVVWKQSQAKLADPFSATTRSSVSIPLYFPTWLPNGYRVDASSITQPQSGTVVLTATNAKHDAIYISEAPVPGGSFDIKTFYGNFLNKQTASTPLGEVSSGMVGGNTKITSLIVNNKTWIIINTKASSTVDDLVSVTRRLQLSQ